MIYFIIPVLYKMNIQPNTSEKENKRQRIYDLLNAKPSKSPFAYFIQRKSYFSFQKMSYLRKRGSGCLYKKRNEGYVTALGTAI